MAVFVEAMHLFQAAYTLKIRIDHRKILPLLVGHDILQSAYFYSGLYKYNRKQINLLTDMKALGYNVVTKEILSASVQSRSIDFSAEMVTEMIAQAAFADRLVVVSSNNRLAKAKKYVAQLGSSMELFALESAVHSYLHQAADSYTNLADLRDEIELRDAASTSLSFRSAI